MCLKCILDRDAAEDRDMSSKDGKVPGTLDLGTGEFFPDTRKKEEDMPPTREETERKEKEILAARAEGMHGMLGGGDPPGLAVPVRRKDSAYFIALGFLSFVEKNPGDELRHVELLAEIIHEVRK